ncbi:HhoA/HhoB/HtrA family serine endopeptidase [Lyngbya confervoides]|uniref:Trypsin-like peptidase domain-containing protein n=1 Tax=Lyngbya confervoides BDU141951 TaxID=1574623 RepID=A0ABD4T8C7_9CYAN|nr:HhoA/HhoB/HtrA family serine endopeptidase [Lyngbya confervoides]MCM1984836.1 trypsin-like peptidase domain-containing protein [Lyngbya confervoides BDU141951]
MTLSSQHRDTRSPDSGEPMHLSPELASEFPPEIASQEISLGYGANADLEAHRVDAPHPRSLVQTFFSALGLVALGAGLMVAGGYATTGTPFPFRVETASDSVPPLAPRPSSFNPGPETFVSTVVESAGPAVVRIEAATPGAKGFQGSMPREFLGNRGQEDPRVQQGVGSGFVFSDRGEIITNAHVVNGADEVTVTLKDGRSFTGQVLGADPVTDLAVVKIDAQNLPTVRFGDAQRLQPGEWAIAIGNPLGLDNTVTTGIISALGRSSGQLGIPDQRVEFIQTDTAINPGNSGGPLLNARGEVIGVNTAIIQGAQGIGFAIPVNTVQKIAQQLIATGEVQHPYLGIQMATLTPDLRQRLAAENQNLPVSVDQGVLVAGVLPNSPAARAGLRTGDVIQSLGDRPVQTAEGVQRLVEDSTIGQSLPLNINRGGQSVALTVRPGRLPS